MTDEIWPGDGAWRWQLITDGVMGGVSRGTLRRETIDGRDAVRMQGDVSLDNNGGFIQIALDLAGDAGECDARAFAGLQVDVRGNGEVYGAHLRSTQTARPQQSWRSTFRTEPRWQTVTLPFADFVPHRIDETLDVSRLRRIGLVAIGRAFVADIAIARLAFYGSTQIEKVGE